MGLLEKAKLTRQASYQIYDTLNYDTLNIDTAKEKPEKMKIDLGCGNNKEFGCIGVDKYPGKDVDFVCDIEHEQLPFENNSADAVCSYSFFEHVQDFDFVLREIWRVCKDGAIVDISVPHFTAPPYEWHVHQYRYKVFEDYEVGKDAMLNTPKLFRCLSRKLVFKGFCPFEKFFNHHPHLYEYTILRSLFPCNSIHVRFQVVKSDYKIGT